MESYIACPMDGTSKTVSWLCYLGLIPFAPVGTVKSRKKSYDAMKKSIFLAISVVLPETLFVGLLLLNATDRNAVADYVDEFRTEDLTTNFPLIVALFGTFFSLQANVFAAILLLKKSGTIFDLNQKIVARLPQTPRSKMPERKLITFLLSKSAITLGFAGEYAVWNMYTTSQCQCKHFIAVLFTAVNIVAFCPLSSYMTELLTKLHIEYLTCHLNSLLNSDDDDTILQDGLNITDFIKSFNDCFGTLILCQCGLCFFNDIILVYFISLSYNLAISFDVTLVFYSTMCLFLNINNTCQKYNLYSLGQKLSRSMRECLFNIQNKRLDGHFTRVDQYKVDLLEQRLGETEPIRPCETFALNFKTLAGSYGLFLTYCIVLIQFHLGSK